MYKINQWDIVTGSP